MKTTPTYKNLPHSFLMVVVLCLFGVFFSSQAYAQDEELLDKVWYLYKLDVNGSEVSYPSLESLNGRESTIEFLDNLVIQFDGCPSFSHCTIEYEILDNEKFIFQSLGCVDYVLCENFRYYYSDYAVFDDLLAEFYYSILPSADTSPEQIMSYTITSENNYFNLMLVNENQDMAYYSTANLSVTDFEKVGFSIYPNPVQNWLYIHLEELSNNSSLEVYDMHGKLLERSMISELETQLDVSEYTSGIYFIKVTDELGSRKVKKFIKQ